MLLFPRNMQGDLHDYKVRVMAIYTLLKGNRFFFKRKRKGNLFLFQSKINLLIFTFDYLKKRLFNLVL